jgi:conjugal transfer pilus assembly protein TraB
MNNLFQNLKPEIRKWAVRAIVAVAIVFIGIPVYMARNRKPAPINEAGQYKVIESEGKDFEQALVTKTQAEIEKLRKEIEKLKQETSKPVPATKTAKDSGPSDEDFERIKKSVEEQLKKRGARVPDLAGQQLFASVNPPPDVNSADRKIEPQTVGIKTIKGYEPQKGLDNDTIYLPPSFMDASLLTGVVAPATQVGQENPIPMLIRIKDMAILPNEVKEDLKGCFAIAEGHGDLGQERVNSRLLNISCITKRGKAIIDQSVKGWVVDADGRAGLSGHVVAKFGSHVARVAIAGFLEGFGEALELSVTETTHNVFGTQSSNLEDTETDTLLKVGGGRAIVGVSNDLQKFYLDLAKQTLPSIEVGPTKNITIVISEGVDLVIKERKKYAEKI